jgi:XTP/dITP diphosphohydrolase
MRELVIASNNKGKIREITQMIDNISLLSLNDIGFTDEIPEPYHTFEENALAKANTVYTFCGKNTFADDSGICANALNGAPGVFSARYSGDDATDESNLQKLADALKNHTDKSGYYKAVICLIWNGEPYFFEGICEGELLSEPRGDGGFGYDPIFIPSGYDKTFAELPADIKHAISHRGKAIRKMVAFVKEQLEEEA